MAPSPQCVEALAYDRANRNRRPVFALCESLTADSDGWRAQRDWRGVGAEIVATETVLWRDGLRSSAGAVPGIGETTAARIDGAVAHVVLSSHRTAGQARATALRLPSPAVTPGSLSLFIAQHWRRLRQGEAVAATYLVLKVPWATQVTLRQAPSASDQVLISVTPANPVLRALFGDAGYRFAPDSPRLRQISGVLDPRDLKRRAGWREYRGYIEYATPLDLTALNPG